VSVIARRLAAMTPAQERQGATAMFHVTGRAVLGHPAGVVWSYLVAFERVPTWEHGVLEVRRVADGPPKVGDRIVTRRVFAGRQTRLEGEIVGLEVGHQATMRLTGGPLDAVEVRYAVEPLDDHRSVVTYEGTGSLRGPLRLLHPLLPTIGRAETRRNLAKLGRRIDAGIPPTSAIDAG
jgi:hypothetical protein